MKALTICQPYAELIARGDKRVENREWPTRYRGPLLIHAGKSREWLSGETDRELEEEFGRKVEFGALVARSRLVDCLHIDHIERGDYDKKYPWLKGDPHANGTWCWVLEDVRRLRSAVPYRGAQGLWDFHEPIEFCDHGIDIDSACASCIDLAIAQSLEGKLCSDCPPVGYPTDKTRCAPCPRRAVSISGDGA